MTSFFENLDSANCASAQCQAIVAGVACSHVPSGKRIAIHMCMVPRWGKGSRYVCMHTAGLNIVEMSASIGR